MYISAFEKENHIVLPVPLQESQIPIYEASSYIISLSSKFMVTDPFAGSHQMIVHFHFSHSLIHTSKLIPCNPQQSHH